MASSLNPITFPGYPTSFNETLIKSNRPLTPSVHATDFLTKRSQLFSDQKGLTSSSWHAKTPIHVCSNLWSLFKFSLMGLRPLNTKFDFIFSWLQAHASICVSKSMRWWEKTLKPNMIEINSAQELVDTLSNSGDRLVIVEFYSPGCGGCKSLHPKVWTSEIPLNYLLNFNLINFFFLFIIRSVNWLSQTLIQFSSKWTMKNLNPCVILFIFMFCLFSDSTKVPKASFVALAAPLQL